MRVIGLQMAALWIGSRYLMIRRRVRRSGPERGDVPGWVMVTVMTAGLVVAIFAIFKGRITDAVTHAIDSVTGKTAS
jgi:hypothetical protein